VSIVNGRLDVFVRGQDGNIWWKYTTNNGATWSNWVKPEGGMNVLAGTAPAVSSGPEIMSGASSHFDLFWVDATSRALMHEYYHPGMKVWGARQNLGGVCTSTPGAAKSAINTLHVFVRGTNGGLWERPSDDMGNTWNPWKNCGEQLYKSPTSTTGYGPAVCARAGTNGILDVFWVDNTKALQYKQWDPTTQRFVNRQNLGGICTATPTAIYSAYSDFPDIYVEVRGTSHLLYERDALLIGDPTQAAATFSTWKGPFQGPP